jgi:flavin-binding protein dodecin
MSLCQEIEVMGVSSQAWERAAAAAVKHALRSFADACIVRHLNEDGQAKPNFTTEVVKFDLTLNDDGQIESYRTTLKVSFMRAVESGSRIRASAIATDVEPSRTRENR